MASCAVSSLVGSEAAHSDAARSEDNALNQIEFFLFLADSVEIDGELTTLVDLETLDEVKAHPVEMDESTGIKTQQNDANLNNRINSHQEEQP